MPEQENGVRKLRKRHERMLMSERGEERADKHEGGHPSAPLLVIGVESSES